jgi:transglutaminase-like putative cysteine protease
VVTGRRSDLAALALAALTVAAGLGFDRVFATGRWVAPVVGAAVLPLLLGALGRYLRWSRLLTLTVSLVAMALYIVWVVEPGTTIAGLPGADTASALRADVRDGWEALRNSRAPAPVTDGALLLAVLSTWVMAATADHLGFRRHATIGAVMPPLVLFVVTAALGTDAGRVPWTLAFALAAIAFLLLQHQALLERGRARFAGPRVASSAGVVVAGVGFGVVAVLGGMLVAPALPGAGDTAVLDYRGLVDDDAETYRTVTPIAGVRSTLLRPERELLFTVRADGPEYWRIAGLDEFDGEVWKLSSTGEEVIEGFDQPAEGAVMRQVFEIGPLGERWMPAAYRPVDLFGADVLVVPKTSTLVTTSDSVSGIDYTVTSEVPPTALSPAQRAATDAPLPDDLEPYTDLPSGFPDDIRSEAEAIAAGLENPYDRAVALDRYFESGFTYDLGVDYGGSTDAMQDFLAERRGFCEQFATTYAAMARAVGLPARVAVGFTPGEEIEPGVFQVTTHEAHAWPEVWFEDVGWMRFEPTPPSSEPGGAEGDAPPAGTEETPGTGTETETPPTTAPTPTAPVPTGPDAEIEIDSPGAGGPDGGGGGVDVGWRAAIGLAAVVVVAGIAYVAVVLGAKTRRRGRRRHDPDATRAVQGAWADTLERLHEAGINPSPASTPLEAAQTAVAQAPVDAREPLRALAATYTETQYGPRAPASEDARDAWAGADIVREALGRGVGAVRRLRRHIDPTVLRRR